MRDGVWVLVPFLVGIYGYGFWIVYLLIAKPGAFVELMYRRPCRWWGLKVVLEDEAKLKRRSRFFGIVRGVLVAGHATFVCWAITSGKW